MFVATLLAFAVALLALGGGAWLTMASAVVMVSGLEHSPFTARQVQQASIAGAAFGLALCIAGMVGLLQLIVMRA